MKKSYSSTLMLLLLMNVSMVWTASSQEQVAQTVYVFDEDFNGSLLSDVQVIGEDGAGNSFEGITDSNGSVVIYGEPGTWQFTFMKEGYDTLDLNYDVTETGEGAVYLQRAAQSQTQNQVAQTIYVYAYDENFNGSLLSDVQVTGEDGAGNSFEGITDSNGSVVIYGEPGTWQFTFMKEGYDTIDVDHDVTQTGEATVYLQRSSQPIQYRDQTESSQTDQQSSTQPIPQQTTDYTT